MPVEGNLTQQERVVDVTVGIVGSGFSGLGMGIRLKKAGIESFVILEKAGDLGGTWRDNDYPGAACDVPTHLYSYSFEPNPNWGHMWAKQPEILEYLKHCAHKYKLHSHLIFNSEITDATFDEAAGKWNVRSKDGTMYRFRALVLGVGGLHIPALPDIKGVRSFEGKVFHSAQWDHSYDLSDKTVAVIGTGASAIQFVPEIAAKVKKLHLFQRTPPWILPRPAAMNRKIGKREQALYGRVPALQKLQRNAMFLGGEAGAVAMVYRPELLKYAETLSRRYIKTAIHDPKIQKAVTPDYRIGCKRILGSSDYYPALNRGNVELVTDGIDSIGFNGIRTKDGSQRDVDAIIFGTGFDVGGGLRKFNLTGLGGIRSTELLQNRVEHYLGINLAGFPNLFVLLGPNTGLGQNSIVFMIEAQTNYALKCIQEIRRKDLAWIDVKRNVQSAFVEDIGERMKSTVWSTGGCQSWYKSEDGTNVTLWPGFCTEYWMRTRTPDFSAYHIESRVTKAGKGNNLS